jgi:heptosyltransferase-2
LTPNQPFIVLNAGSQFPSRRWLSQRYAELAGKIYQELNQAVVYVGGPSSEETEIAQQSAEASGVAVVNLAGKTSLTELAVLLKKASLLVTADTGIMHIASAVGCPVVVLAGAGDMETTSPWTEKAVLLDKHVYCSPCVKNFCINGKEPMLCMKSIGVDEVFIEIKSLCARK